MDFRFSSKRDLYYEKAMKLYYQEGMRVTQISRALPVSRAILYKWIAIFAEQNPQKASMKGVKKSQEGLQTFSGGSGRRTSEDCYGASGRTQETAGTA